MMQGHSSLSLMARMRFASNLHENLGSIRRLFVRSRRVSVFKHSTLAALGATPRACHERCAQRLRESVQVHWSHKPKHRFGLVQVRGIMWALRARGRHRSVSRRCQTNRRGAMAGIGEEAAVLNDGVRGELAAHSESNAIVMTPGAGSSEHASTSEAPSTSDHRSRVCDLPVYFVGHVRKAPRSGGATAMCWRRRRA